jgi:hypothetical protein
MLVLSETESRGLKLSNFRIIQYFVLRHPKHTTKLGMHVRHSFKNSLFLILI